MRFGLDLEQLCMPLLGDWEGGFFLATKPANRKGNYASGDILNLTVRIALALDR
jgi:hypothetical protein